MPRFEYFEPVTLDEAVELLQFYGDRASLLAGGTDLLVEIKEHIRQPQQVINIKRIPELAGITFDEFAGLRFGALTTARQLERDAFVQEKYAGFHQALVELGSIQVRNRATVAGNLCRASPSADTPPPLIADEAVAKIYGPQGTRDIPLEGFFLGPGQTVLGTGEILIGLQVPVPETGTGKVYIKHGRRKAMELATVGVAVSLKVRNGVCERARVVLGAVAPTPIRVTSAETVLEGQKIDEQHISEAAQAAQVEARPISDVRASAAYRSEMVRVLTARAVRLAAERAVG